MVAYGTMATAGKVEYELQHYVPLGSIVLCVDPYGMFYVHNIGFIDSSRFAAKMTNSK